MNVALEGKLQQQELNDDNVESGSIGAPSVDNESATTGSMSHTGDRKDTPEEIAIASDETKKVFRLRLVLLAVLLGCTIGVAISVYKYVFNAEESTFESQFEDDSVKVLGAIGSALDLSLGSVDAFLVGVVSYARDTNQTWPFVTYPDAAVRLAKLRSLSKAILVTQYHYVTGEERAEWEPYSVANDGWVQEGIDVQAMDDSFHGKIVESYWTRGDIHDSGDPYYAPGPYLPKWQQSPVVPIYAPYNWDAMTHNSLEDTIEVVRDDRHIAVSDVGNLPRDDSQYAHDIVDGNNHFIKDFLGDEEDETEPFSELYFPILHYAADYVTIPEEVKKDDIDDFAGVFAMTFYWRDLIKDILPRDSNGIVVVIENACHQAFTYQVNGPETIYLGEGDLHESKYDYMAKHSPLIDLEAFSLTDRSYKGLPLSDKGCSAYYLSVYASSEMEDDYVSSDPVIFMMVSVAIFVFTSLLFIFYDNLVERRQKKVMTSAVQSRAIVSSLFPSTVRDRLFSSKPETKQSRFESNKKRLVAFLSDGKQEQEGKYDESSPDSTPIADLFPDCTVVFSDISGFTAWSSVREPSQVFRLLESLYHAFDIIAKRRGVFKVETIGDAYVAVVGLPEPRKDHAVVMAKFSRDCLHKTLDIVRDLETSLGPGTGDLRLRFGLHSGAVTAGVLRGEKGRFQLFGDSVNTASRMESTGTPNKIQASSATVELLTKAGKGNWAVAREEAVEVKGKGAMQTYWIEPKLMASSAPSSTGTPREVNEMSGMDGRTKRLVEWNTDVLTDLIKKVVAKRNATEPNHADKKCSFQPSTGFDNDTTVLEGLKDSVSFPEFDASTLLAQENPNEIDLDEKVLTQLHEYVVSIATLYKSNPFHCFQHASHVTMTSAKLLTRVIKPDHLLSDSLFSGDKVKLGTALHDHSFGISSDPLAQLACVFAAIVHDVDHPGVSNSELVREEATWAVQYKSKSIVQQNAFEIAWGLFLDQPFEALREAICPTQAEFEHFEALVSHAVLATDKDDQELNEQRDARWKKSFSGSMETGEMDQKATLLIEHLIQASDVAHTMQHWNIYRKWNEKLFEECSLAYQSGRSKQDPTEYWFEAELSCFDNVVMPLVGKMKESGAFGESCDEYMAYALRNREEWERRGHDEVASMAERCKVVSEA